MFLLGCHICFIGKLLITFIHIQNYLKVMINWIRLVLVQGFWLFRFFLLGVFIKIIELPLCIFQLTARIFFVKVIFTICHFSKKLLLFLILINSWLILAIIALFLQKVIFLVFLLLTLLGTRLIPYKLVIWPVSSVSSSLQLPSFLGLGLNLSKLLSFLYQEGLL